MKTDIFKGIMFYILKSDRKRGTVVALTKERVAEIKEMNVNGEKPDRLVGNVSSGWIPGETMGASSDSDDIEFADVTGEIELPEIKKRKGRRNNKRRRDNRGKGKQPQNSNVRNEKKSSGIGEEKKKNNRGKKRFRPKKSNKQNNKE